MTHTHNRRSGGILDSPSSVRAVPFSQLVGVAVPFLFKWAVDCLAGVGMADAPAMVIGLTPVGLMVGYGLARAAQVTAAPTFVPLGIHSTST